MATLTPKQREVNEREGQFLEIARDLLFKRGYHGLTMDRIADATEYSKGTVYHHFRCKEEIIITLARRSLDRRLGLFERAATFRGRPRERMVAVGEAVEICTRLYPHDWMFFQIINAEAIIQKASDKLLYEMRASAHRCANVMTGIVRDGVAQGDLVLPPGTKPEELTFALWALTEGTYAVSSWISPSEVGIADPYGTVMKNCDVLGDGYAWRPLSTEWDYAETRRRVRGEIFPGEARKAYRL